MTDTNIVYAIVGVALVLVWAAVLALMTAKVIAHAVVTGQNAHASTTARIQVWSIAIGAAGFLVAAVLA